MIKTINARDIGWSVIDTDYSPDQRFLIYSSWSRYGTYPVPRSAGHAHPHVAARVAHPPPPPSRRSQCTCATSTRPRARSCTTRSTFSTGRGCRHRRMRIAD